MSILKYLGGALPRKTIFTQFFEQGNTLDLHNKFSDLCLLAKWYYTKKQRLRRTLNAFKLTHAAIVQLGYSCLAQCFWGL